MSANRRSNNNVLFGRISCSWLGSIKGKRAAGGPQGDAFGQVGAIANGRPVFRLSQLWFEEKLDRPGVARPLAVIKFSDK